MAGEMEFLKEDSRKGAPKEEEKKFRMAEAKEGQTEKGMGDATEAVKEV